MTDLRRTVSRMIEKMPWTRAFRRRREAAEQGNELTQTPFREPTTAARLSEPNGSARGAQATVEGLLYGSQIRPVFQPVVDLHTDRVRGWEALYRGPSGTHLHAPVETFAAAKDLPFNLALELDRHFFPTTLSFARGLPKEAKLFLNIRPYLIHDPSSLVEIVEQHGMGRARIVLEISERYATGRGERGRD